MSTQCLPAASLRTGNRLPAGCMLLWVPKYLIRTVLSSICSSICGAATIFLPVLREAPGRGSVRSDDRYNPVAQAPRRGEASHSGGFLLSNIAACLIGRYNRPAFRRARCSDDDRTNAVDYQTGRNPARPDRGDQRSLRKEGPAHRCAEAHPAFADAGRELLRG